MPSPRPMAAAAVALLPRVSVALLCVSAPTRSARAAHLDSLEVSASSAAPLSSSSLPWKGSHAQASEEALLFGPALGEVEDAAVFLQTALVTSHRSPAAAATASVPKATSRPVLGHQGDAGDSDNVSHAALVPSAVQDGIALAAGSGHPVAAAQTLDKAAAEAAALPLPPRLSPPSAVGSLGGSLRRFFEGTPEHPVAPAERQKRELVAMLLASVVLQVLLLKISSRMAENNRGKQSLEDIVRSTDFNQG